MSDEQAYDLETLLLQLREIIDTARTMPMSASVLVNREETLEIVDDALRCAARGAAPRPLAAQGARGVPRAGPPRRRGHRRGGAGAGRAHGRAHRGRPRGAPGRAAGRLARRGRQPPAAPRGRGLHRPEARRRSRWCSSARCRRCSEGREQLQAVVEPAAARPARRRRRRPRANPDFSTRTTVLRPGERGPPSRRIRPAAILGRPAPGCYPRAPVSATRPLPRRHNGPVEVSGRTGSASLTNHERSPHRRRRSPDPPGFTPAAAPRGRRRGPRWRARRASTSRSARSRARAGARRRRRPGHGARPLGRRVQRLPARDRPPTSTSRVGELFEPHAVDGETYPCVGHEIDLEQLVRDARAPRAPARAHVRRPPAPPPLPARRRRQRRRTTTATGRSPLGRALRARALIPTPPDPPDSRAPGALDARPQAQDAEEQDAPAPRVELASVRARPLDLPELRRREAAAHRVQQLRLVRRPPGDRRRVDAEQVPSSG